MHCIKKIMVLTALGSCLAAQLASAALFVGQTVTLPFDPLSKQEWKVNSTVEGGTLLFSDSPEMVKADGIMYQDTVQGKARLFFHHVNATTEDKRIAVVLENNGDEAAEVTVIRQGLGGPSYNYLQVGKDVQQQYMKGFNAAVYHIPPHSQLSLMDIAAKPNMLLNGMYDFATDKPVCVKTVMLPLTADLATFAQEAAVLPQDEHPLRGTFIGGDRLFVPEQPYNPGKDGTVVMTLADNHLDEYAWGIDATNGAVMQNYGNYGVVYRVFIPSVSGGRMSVYLNPRGGEYAGSIGVSYQHAFDFVADTPADRLSIGGHETDFSYLGTFDTGKSLWLTFSPPGASNLPVKLVLVPEAK